MKKIFLQTLIILTSLLTINMRCENTCVIGILIIENQTDYDLTITFHERFKNNILGDSLFLKRNKHWEKRISTDGINLLRILSGDSATILYNDEKIQVHAPPVGIPLDFIVGNMDWPVDSNLQKLADNKRYMFNEQSYIISGKQPSKNLLGQRKGCNERTYRYIFTNADYEAAKPINP